ncbi:MAG: linear amide C-N hydrolase [Dehalococcoidia bacterium]|nr:MAG: linear amide C-N hydrolase [Dehalococcoidia bacterium]
MNNRNKISVLSGNSRGRLALPMGIISVIVALLSLGITTSCVSPEVSTTPIIFSETTVLDKQTDTFSTVRQIQIQGTQRQIGYKMAEIAQDRYGVTLATNASPDYGKARYAYLEKNYPALLERSRGVLDAYGLKDNDPSVDPTALMYSLGDIGCSMIYFPGSTTENGHAMAIRNMDFTCGSISQLMGMPRQPGEPDIFGEIYVVISQPDEGYSCLYLSSIDMLNGALDGINEHGLTIYALVDHGVPQNRMKAAGNMVIGLNPFQTVRLVLETCRNCEEAKQVLLTNKIFDVIKGMHYLVGDAQGNSFIFEVNKMDEQAHIQDGEGRPQVMTNSTIWDMPPPDQFPQTFTDPYDSFNRYQILTQAINSQVVKYSESFMVSAVESVFPRKSSADLGGPAMTLRPLWQVIYDMSEPSMKVRFWLKDAGTDDSGNAVLAMSEWYEFGLTPD